MELLNIIIDPKTIESTCFLCYKPNADDALCIFEDIEIWEEHTVYSVSLWKITQYLFPTYDIVLNQACKGCTDLVIKMYIALKRSYWKSKLLKKLINNISTEIHEQTSNGDQKSEITIKLTHKCNEIKISDSKQEYTTENNMRFESKEIMQKHLKTIDKNTNDAVICDKCGKHCKTPGRLRTHLQSHELKRCPYCSKVLKSHSHFKLHIKSHSTIVKRQRNRNHYSCNDCNYMTTNKSTLESHTNKIHLNIRPYVCGICSKGFFKKSNLSEHSLIHNNEKNNMCEVCGENFVNVKTLNEHLRLHSGRKPFKCDICNHTFVTHSRKNEHIKRKHTEKNECCIICNRKYSLKKDLNTHMKRIHNHSMEVQCSQFVGTNIGQSYIVSTMNV